MQNQASWYTLFVTNKPTVLLNFSDEIHHFSSFKSFHYFVFNTVKLNPNKHYPQFLVYFT